MNTSSYDIPDVCYMKFRQGFISSKEISDYVIRWKIREFMKGNINVWMLNTSNE